jgi:hypothetical protein
MMDDLSLADRRRAWFASFLADRGTRKPSPHTLKAYGQDFDAIAAIIEGGEPDAVPRMPLSDISTESMRVAFAQYAETHSAASILRCWSTWNAVHLPIHVRTHHGESHARSRPASRTEELAKVAARQRSRFSDEHPQRRT